MKAILILTVAVIFSSCSGEFDQTIEYKIDSRLEKHVDQFFIEAEARNIHLDKSNLIVTMVEELDAIAIANTVGSQRIVRFKREHYEYIITNWGDEALENVVFHELGHALLYLDHTHDDSLMASEISLKVYKGNPELRKYYIDELFSRK